MLSALPSASPSVEPAASSSRLTRSSTIAPTRSASCAHRHPPRPPGAALESTQCPYPLQHSLRTCACMSTSSSTQWLHVRTM